VLLGDHRLLMSEPVLETGSHPRAQTPELTASPEGSGIEPSSLRFVLGAALGVGAVSFLATELMHYLLVPDLGRSDERFLAEGFSAVIVTCLTALLIHMARERHRLIVARMQVIAEMNHHIRNALTPISLSTQVIENRELLRIISESINRIDWALREILPREQPLVEEQRNKLGYFQKRRSTHK